MLTAPTAPDPRDVALPELAHVTRRASHAGVDFTVYVAGAPVATMVVDPAWEDAAGDAPFFLRAYVRAVIEHAPASARAPAAPPAPRLQLELGGQAVRTTRRRASRPPLALVRGAAERRP